MPARPGADQPRTEDILDAMVDDCCRRTPFDDILSTRCDPHQIADLAGGEGIRRKVQVPVGDNLIRRNHRIAPTSLVGEQFAAPSTTTVFGEVLISVRTEPNRTDKGQARIGNAAAKNKTGLVIRYNSHLSSRLDIRCPGLLGRRVYVVSPDVNATDHQRGAVRFDGAPGRRTTPQSLKELATEYIREGVVSGRLKPGAKVDQDEIAGELGISRLPVREALIELTASGVVESIPRRGAFIARLTTDDIEDHFTVISLLFGLTARRAASQITDEQLHELQQIHTEATTTQDPSRRLTLDNEFYRVLNRIATSDRLLLTLRFLALALPNDFYSNTARWPATETAYRERILNALESHDAEAAAKATDEHFRMCAKVTIEDLRARGYWSETESQTSSADRELNAAGR